MVTAPSPTAEATRLTDPWRTSPAANTPGQAGLERQRPWVGGPAGDGAAWQVRAGEDESLPVAGDGFAEPVGPRLGADEDEQGVRGDGPPRPGGGVLQDQRFEMAGAGAVGHLHAVADVDVRGGADLADEVVGHAGGQRPCAHQDGHLTGPFGQVQRGLPGGVAAAGDEHGPPAHGRGLAGRGAVEDVPARVTFDYAPPARGLEPKRVEHLQSGITWDVTGILDRWAHPGRAEDTLGKAILIKWWLLRVCGRLPRRVRRVHHGGQLPRRPARLVDRTGHHRSPAQGNLAWRLTRQLVARTGCAGARSAAAPGAWPTARGSRARTTARRSPPAWPRPPALVAGESILMPSVPRPATGYLQVSFLDGKVITWGAAAAPPFASGRPGSAAAGTRGRRTRITARAPTARCAAAPGSGGDGCPAGIFPRSETDRRPAMAVHRNAAVTIPRKSRRPPPHGGC
jgi:hypothetical protein